MVTCEDIYEQASAFHDGDLSPEGTEEFSRHLEVCVWCDNFYRSFELTVSRAREVLVREPPPGLAEAMVAEVRKAIDDCA